MQLTKVNFWNKWMRNGRKPARPPYRFTEVKPLKLRNEVSSGTKVASDVVCIPQMMDMMSCFKLNDFDQSKCQNQINSFQDCYNKYLVSKEERKSRRDPSIPIPGQTKLTKDQMNHLLRSYPQPN